MILIADSGSTKTSWALISPGDVTYINTSGINPAVQDHAIIEDVIRTELLHELKFSVPKITLIAFYGAGCNENGCKVLSKILGSVFQCKLICSSDLTGSAIATIGNDEGIVSILGTGSNSGLFKNGILKEHVPSLGYILGDEGSGSNLGKQLLADYFKRQMPKILAIEFKTLYHPVESDVIDAIYRKAKPNQYLASFVPFINTNIDTEYCQNLLRSSFRKFFERNISVYSKYKDYQLAFTGSVAYGFRDILYKTALDFDMEITKILKNPIEGLVNYYKQLL